MDSMAFISEEKSRTVVTNELGFPIIEMNLSKRLNCSSAGQDHVLSCYKTEQCRKPARLCRQGYACPFYHNSKDRRRPPAICKYRSTPCPAAKTVDEWLDPELCEAGDSCQYCHTRTEQQFHPEIYKSTKCNDMLEVKDFIFC
nr:zinc finger protein [Haemonchus contortus]